MGTIPGERIQSRDTSSRPAMFAHAEDRLIISFVDKLLGVDVKSRKIAWSHEPDSRQRSGRRRNRYGKSLLPLAARPLLIGDKLFVRHGVLGRPLTCIDPKTGKFAWSKRYDDYVLSDPIRIGPWVSVITGSGTSGAALQLHRVSPKTGESSLSSPLVRAKDMLTTIGSPTVVGDAIVFRAEGCLVNCDLRGTVRWARRLPFIPASVRSDLHKDRGMDSIIVRDQNVILSLPGCPYLMCISARDGKTLWSFMTPPSAEILGIHAGSVIVVESDTICALDPDTGKVRWRQSHQHDLAAVIPAEKDSLVSVYLAKPSKSGYTKGPHLPFGGRLVRWISARDGSTLKEIPIEGDSGTYHTLQITSDGKRIFGLAAFEQNKLPRIFSIDLQN